MVAKQFKQACGPVKSFKRLITPAGKPQGFGFAEFEDPDSALRAMSLLNNVELPALEEGCVSKKLLVSVTILEMVVFRVTDKIVWLGQSRRKDKEFPRCVLSTTYEHKRMSPLMRISYVK